METYVSQSISNGMGSLRPLVVPEDVKQLLEQINKLCGKIRVANVNLSIPFIHLLDVDHDLHPPSRRKLHSSRNYVTHSTILLMIVP